MQRRMNEYLTPAELVELTEARTRPAQERWLRANGLLYVVTSKGHIRVLRTHRDARLGCGKQARPAGADPDFSVFRQRA